MKKNNKAKKEQKPLGRVPTPPKDMVELSEKELEQVQGGGHTIISPRDPG